MAFIGFIGLGIMGLPMAANLVAAGHRVRGFSRTSATREAAAERGIETRDSLREAVTGADVVITMLPDTPDVEGVLLGAAGVFAQLVPGAVVIDMSTIDPQAARELHRQATESGVTFLDAPVSGGQAGAVAAQLSIMVGGEEGDLQKVRGVLGARGATIVHVGGSGAGQTVKAANQIVVAGNIQVLAEALIFLRKQDVDLERSLEVLGGGLAGSTVIQRKREALLRLELHHKDLGIAQRAASAADAALPVAALVTQFVQSMVARGSGGLDHSALYALIAELNGEEL